MIGLFKNIGTFFLLIPKIFFMGIVLWPAALAYFWDRYILKKVTQTFLFYLGGFIVISSISAIALVVLILDENSSLNNDFLSNGSKPTSLDPLKIKKYPEINSDFKESLNAPKKTEPKKGILFYLFILSTVAGCLAIGSVIFIEGDFDL